MPSDIQYLKCCLVGKCALQVNLEIKGKLDRTNADLKALARKGLVRKDTNYEVYHTTQQGQKLLKAAAQ